PLEQDRRLALIRSPVASFVARARRQRLQEGLLVPAGHDVDAPQAAVLLAQLAADAGLLVDLDPPQVAGEVVWRGRDAVEGADIHADATAVAIVGVDDGD